MAKIYDYTSYGQGKSLVVHIVHQMCRSAVHDADQLVHGSLGWIRFTLLL